MNEILKELGINVGISVAGFFGSLLMVGKSSAYNLKRTLVSLLAGVASANYLTPIVRDIMNNFSTEHYEYSIAFMLGFLGLKGIESIMNKMQIKK